MQKSAIFWGHNTLRTILGCFKYNFSFLRTDNNPYFFRKLSLANKGFTLIELITAIGVLAILTSVVIAAINPLEQFRKSADSRRKSDLAQIQRGLEVYYQDYGRYPASGTGDNVNKICKDLECATIVDWGDDFRPYMDVLPVDQNGAKNYAYWVDESNGGQSYALYASLDRGGKDPQACNGGGICTNAIGHGALNADISCGGVCNYGVSSSNIAP